MIVLFFFFKQKTAYEMRISDWSSDVCSSDLLMAYKDEYEVARLYADPEFMQRMREQSSGDFTLRFNLAPPMLPGRDTSARPQKRSFAASSEERCAGDKGVITVRFRWSPHCKQTNTITILLHHPLPHNLQP